MNDGLDGQTMTSHGDGSTNSAGGHLESPLFTRLPVELRLQIYQDVFHGSTAQSNYFPWHGPAADRCDWCHPKYMYQLRHSGHHRLLLTCHAVYKEATALYWSSTIINMGQERGPDYDPWWPGRGWSPSIGDSVCAIPAYARQYIQHITNVYRAEGINANIRGWWLAKGISYLPSLKTCRLRDVIQMGPDEHNIIGNNLKNKDQVGRDEFIIDFCVDNADVGPRLHAPFEEPLFEEPFFAAVIVQKYRIKHTDPEARYCPDTASDQVQTGFIQEGFINHTTRRIYHTIVDSKVVNMNEDLSDDCAIQRVIGDASLVPVWPRQLPTSIHTLRSRWNYSLYEGDNDGMLKYTDTRLGVFNL